MKVTKNDFRHYMLKKFMKSILYIKKNQYLRKTSFFFFWDISAMIKNNNNKKLPTKLVKKKKKNNKIDNLFFQNIFKILCFDDSFNL